MRRSKEQILFTSSITSRRIHILEAFSFSIKSESRFTSNLLQSIRASRLVRARKLQIREVFNNIRSRNRIASNSHFLSSASDLRNRLFHHTNYRHFPIAYLLHLSRRYRAFSHTNCSSSLIVYFVHLSSMSSSSLVKLVASATILSNRTMSCIDIYEQSISIKHLVMNLRSFERSSAISWLEDFWAIDEETDCFFTSLHVLLIDFSKNESHVFATRHNENVVIFFVRWHLLR